MKTTGVRVAAILSMATVLVCGQESRSFNGTFRVSVQVPQKLVRNAPEETIWTYRVLDTAGTMVTEVRRSMPFDVAAPDAMVFETGRLLLLHSYDAYAEVYDRTGDLLRRTPLLGEPFPDYERTVRGAMHVSQAIVGMTMSGEGVRVLSIDENGNVTVRRTIDGMNVTGVVVARDPGLVAIGTMSWKQGSPAFETTIVEGENAWHIDRGFTKGVFTDRGRFIGIGERSVYAVMVGKERPEWVEDVPRERMLVDAIVWNGRLSLLSADKPKWFEGGWVYTAPKLKTLDANGKTVSTTNIPRNAFSKGTLELEKEKVIVILDGDETE